VQQAVGAALRRLCPPFRSSRAHHAHRAGHDEDCEILVSA